MTVAMRMRHPAVIDAGPRAPFASWHEELRLTVGAGIAAALLLCGWAAAALHVRSHHRHAPVAQAGLPGVTLDAVAGGAQDATLVVTSLRSRGAASAGGVRVGDGLAGIDRWPVAGRRALARTLAADPARVIVLHLRRGGRMVDVPLDRGGRGGAP